MDPFAPLAIFVFGAAGVALMLGAIRRRESSRAVLGLAFVLVACGIWFVGVYDTAAGRCGRGDLGACAVYLQQHGYLP